MGRLVTTKKPLSSVVTVRTSCVPMLVMVMVAPGMTLPVWSSTLPAIWPTRSARAEIR